MSIASAKGGCSKTTLAILLGAEFALANGLRVALLDSDLNQHASAFVFLPSVWAKRADAVESTVASVQDKPLKQLSLLAVPNAQEAGQNS